MTEINDEMLHVFHKASVEALSKRGHVNILLGGKTGTGKSTLVNAMFGQEIAKTGQGKPVTQHFSKHSKEGCPVSIYDSKGLELADYQIIQSELMQKLQELNSSPDPKEHVHVAWLCIAEGARRVEDAEVSLAKSLASLKIPVIVAITTAVSDQGFQAEVKKQFPMAKAVVRVNSVPFQMDEDVTLPAKNLEALVDATMNVVPEAHKNAFLSAQKVKLSLKVAEAEGYVAAATIAAAAVGATPIPFSDAIALAPIQIGMMAKISAIFGIHVSDEFLSKFMTAAGGASMVGKTVATGLFKLFPGVGTILGGMISAGTAGTLTKLMGDKYISVLKEMFEKNPDHVPDATEVGEALAGKMRMMDPALVAMAAEAAFKFVDEKKAPEKEAKLEPAKS
jgi:uncharacterized protein (DUF697 family)/GTP-binding protein EngB required for normal cell division